jgi:hypothetical protein
MNGFGKRATGVAAFIVGLVLAGAAGAAVLPSDFGADDGQPVVPSRPPLSDRQTDVQNLSTGEWFATIFDALADPDTLDGHTLQVVAPSVVEGQVLVGKSVTIQGATGAEVVQMGVDTGTSGDASAWFVVDTGVTVTVRDLVFDGSGHLVYRGFRVKGVATIEDCTFRNIQYEPSGPAYQGQAVTAAGNSVVRRCTFESIGRLGVLFSGTGVTAGLAEDNVYTGKGAGNYLEYGFEISSGATATYRRNTVAACLGVTPSGFDSAGMLVTTFSGPTASSGTFTSNVMLGNLRGLQVGAELAPPGDPTNATAAFNRIVGNIDMGIGSVSTGAVLTENNWFGCNAGPGAAGCDLATGTQDADPWLTLTITAVPSILVAGQTSALTAAVTLNSDGVDTSGLGWILDGTEIALSGTLGSVAPPVVGTSGGVAGAVYTAGATLAMGSGIATLDNQTVSTPIEIVIPVELMRFSVE